jgi:glycerol-3-phosphate acyltransferase PlsY
MSDLATNLLWIGFAFLCGSLPMAYWLGRVFLHTDIRQYGDGNPGGANVWRAGGKWWGLLAIFLDALKGLVPVALANFWAGIGGWALAAVALAPIFGHAYTPFLGFNGGKALSVTFGVWTGLTLWQGPVVLGLALAVWLKILVVEGWAILAGMLTLLLFFLLAQAPPTWLAVWAGSFLLFMWKHRGDFRRPPPLAKGILGRFLPKS